jgi:type IV pilus assembly protein PilX
MRSKYTTRIDKQTGSILVISLIILVAMTLIGITAMRTSVMEEKMAGNMRNKELAFQAAEATLRAAEQNIQDLVISTVSFDTDGSDGLYNFSTAADSTRNDRIWEIIDWDGSDSLEYTAFDSSYNIGTAPRYVIQHLATTGNDNDKLNMDNMGQGTGGGNVEAFLITVRATGGNDNSAVILQSTWGKRL